MAKHQRLLALAAVFVAAASLGGCGRFPTDSLNGGGARLTERECMARVMYFESNRSSDDGMLAVGTVVMNRLESPKYPKTVCSVVGQHVQFAEGALTKPVDKRHSSWARALRAADAVLGGERHAGVGRAMFFHTAGYKFPYRNMKYVTLAGGNIFYDKRYPAPGAPAWPSATMFAASYGKSEPASRPVMMARAEIPATAGSEDTERFEPASERRQAPVRAERRPAVETPKPVMLARAAAADEEDEAPIVRTPARASPPAVAARSEPIVVARTWVRPASERDDEDDAPIVKATARSKVAPLPAKPQPIVTASLQSAPPAKWRPSDIAATLRDAKSSQRLAAPRAAPPTRSALAFEPALAAKAGTAKAGLAAAAAQPPAKPKPIILAMASEPKGRAAPPPRSIADLIGSTKMEGRRSVR